MYGLIVDDRGRHRGLRPGRFTALLAREGIEIEGLPIAEDGSLPAIANARGQQDAQVPLRLHHCPLRNGAARDVPQVPLDFVGAGPAW